MKISIQTKKVDGVNRRKERYLKWRLYRLSRKFSRFTSSKLFIRKEGANPGEYLLTLKLQVNNQWIVIKRKGEDLLSIIEPVIKSAHQQLARFHR